MQSSDREILLDIQGQIYHINTRLDEQGRQITELQEVQKKQGQQISDLQEGLKTTNHNIELLAQTVQHMDERLSGSIADLRTTAGWGLAVVGIFLAFITFAVTCFAFLKREKTEKSELERAQNNSRLLRLEMLQVLQEYGLIPERRG